jgi:hypothetical protein
MLLKTDFAAYSITPEKSFLALEYNLTKKLLTGILNNSNRDCFGISFITRYGETTANISSCPHREGKCYPRFRSLLLKAEMFD